MSSPQEELRAKREQMLQKVEKSRLKCASPALPDAKGSAGTASSSPASPEVAASGSSQPAPTCVSPQLLDHELSEGPLSPVECTSAEASQGDELCGTQAKVPRRSDSPVLDRRCESPVMNGASNGEISGSPFNWPSGSGIPMAAGAPSATNGPTYVTINVLNSGNSLSALLSSFLNNFQANTGRPAICPPAVSEFQLQECPSPKPDKLQECPSPKPDKLQECPSPKPDTEPGDDIVDLTTPPPASPASPDLAFMRDDTDDELDEQDPDDPDFLPVGMPKASLPPRVPQPRKVSRLSLGAPKRNCHGVLQASLERFRADGAGPSRDTVQNPSAMQQPDGLAEARNVIAAGMARMAAEIQAHAPHQPQQAQAAAVQPLYPVHQPLHDQAAALDPADGPIYPAPHLQAQAAALDPAWAPAQALQEVRQAGLPAPQAVAQGPAVPQVPQVLPPGPPQPNAEPHGTLCNVCLVNPLGGILRCNHLFCIACLTHLKELRRPCPMCRKVFRKWKVVFP